MESTTRRQAMASTTQLVLSSLVAPFEAKSESF